MPSPAQMITLSSAAPPLRVTGLRGHTAPVPTGGFGGWNQTPRPRRKALTQWSGGEPYQIQFSMLFDGNIGDVSVEAQCLALERMARPPAEHQEPPLVRITGAVPRPNIVYVINDLQWDTDPIWHISGFRVRQEVTVVCMEYVADDRLTATPAAERARRKAAAAAASAAKKGGGAATKGKTYIVKQGDTLMSIAAHELGKASRWTEIAKLNDIRDPRSIKPKQRLRLP